MRGALRDCEGRTDGRSHSLEPGRRVCEPGPTCEQFLIYLGEKNFNFKSHRNLFSQNKSPLDFNKNFKF